MTKFPIYIYITYAHPNMSIYLCIYKTLKRGDDYKAWIKLLITKKLKAHIRTKVITQKNPKDSMFNIKVPNPKCIILI